MDGTNEKLDRLWLEYREACPDPEPSEDFMPGLWKRIEEQSFAITLVFRRLAQVCVVSALVLTIAMAVVIPRLQRLPVYTATYEDVLAADHPSSYVDILNGDIK